MPRREPDPNLENIQTSCLRSIQSQVKRLRELSETSILDSAQAQNLIGYTKTISLLRVQERQDEARKAIDLAGFDDQRLREKLLDLGYSERPDDCQEIEDLDH
jgi:hypothetical protein